MNQTPPEPGGERVDDEAQRQQALHEAADLQAAPVDAPQVIRRPRPVSPTDPAALADGGRAGMGGVPITRNTRPGTGGERGTGLTNRVTMGELERGEVQAGTHPGDRYVRHVRPTAMGFRRISSGHLEALATANRPTTPAGRIFDRLKRLVIGMPISTAEAVHERLTNVKALAVLSSDALSSVAYATEAILATLLIAGSAAFSLNVPISFAIAILIGIVIFSYRQTIFAYPKGGGSYIVSKDNLGTLPGLLAGASLLTDYILTVAVSISAGIASLVSLAATIGSVDLKSLRVEAALFAVVLLVLLNLRGIREAGTIFAAPSYIFLVLMFIMIGIGLLQYFLGWPVPLGTVTHVPDLAVAEGTLEQVGLVLLLRAFASGCTALTGIEAISDGVPAFQRPEAKNAAQTLVVLGVLLSIMFLGISFLADHAHVQISHTETVVSQLGRTIFGSDGAGGFIYGALLIFTALILVLAANTSFADFPRLGFFLARDKFLPHQFAFRGDRLAYSFGIITLGVMAAILIIAFRGQTDALLPLYAIGVFSSFTLSQSGMVMRWWRTRPPRWQVNLAINALGATTTFVVLLVLAVAHFTEGAWIIMVIVPLLVLLFLGIHKHYTTVSQQGSLKDVDPQMGRAAQAGGMFLSAPEMTMPNEATAAGLAVEKGDTPRPLEHLVIIPVAGVNQVTLRTVAYARSITSNVVAVHVASDEEAEEVAALEAKWQQWMPAVTLVVVESPYRSLTRPLLAYIDALHQQQPDRVLTVVLPEFVPGHWWEHLLHNQTALRLKGALLGRPGIVVTSVPYHLDRGPSAAAT